MYVLFVLCYYYRSNIWQTCVPGPYWDWAFNPSSGINHNFCQDFGWDFRKNCTQNHGKICYIIGILQFVIYRFLKSVLNTFH